MAECQRCQILEQPVLNRRTLQNIRDFVRNAGRCFKKDLENPFVQTSQVAKTPILSTAPPPATSNTNAIPSITLNTTSCHLPPFQAKYPVSTNLLSPQTGILLRTSALLPQATIPSSSSVITPLTANPSNSNVLPLYKASPESTQAPHQDNPSILTLQTAQPTSCCIVSLQTATVTSLAPQARNLICANVTPHQVADPGSSSLLTSQAAILQASDS